MTGACTADTAIEKKISQAYQHGRLLVNEAEALARALKVHFDFIMMHHNAFSKIRHPAEDLDEYKDVQLKYTELKTMISTEYSKNEIEQGLRSERLPGLAKEDLPFFYANYDEKSSSGDAGKDANYFNYKYYKLRQATSNLTNYLKKYDDIIRATREYIDGIENARRSINGKILMLKYQDKFPLAKTLLERIRNKKLKELEAATSGKIFLKDISEFFKSAKFDLDHFSQDLDYLLSQVNEVRIKEVEFIALSTALSGSIQNSEQFLIGSTHYEQIQKLKEKQSGLHRMYLELPRNVAIADGGRQEDLRHVFDEISLSIKSIIGRMKETQNELHSLRTLIETELESQRRLFLKFMSALDNSPIVTPLKNQFQIIIDLALKNCHEMDNPGSAKYSDINKEIYEFRKSVYQKVEESKLLSRNESTVFLELLALLPDKDYVNLQDVVRIISQRLSKEDKDVYQTVTVLVTKKLVKLGISHPF